MLPYFIHIVGELFAIVIVGIPIMIGEGSRLALDEETEGDNAANLPHRASLPQLVTAVGSPDPLNTYTLLMSKNKANLSSSQCKQSKSSRKQSKSHSSSDCCERSGASKRDQSQKLLPPSDNQALRTARWVNEVNRSPSSESPNSYQLGKCVTRVEINHKEETEGSAYVMVEIEDRGSGTGLPPTRNATSETFVDLATSEV